MMSIIKKDVLVNIYFYNTLPSRRKLKEHNTSLYKQYEKCNNLWPFLFKIVSLRPFI